MRYNFDIHTVCVCSFHAIEMFIALMQEENENEAKD